MTETLHRPPVESRERHHLAVDAFLSAALIFLVALVVAFGVLVLLSPPVRIGGDTEGPWLLVIVAALAAVAFLAKPVATAVRDLAGPREHPRRHVLRLAIVALALVAIVVSIVIGGESAELGLFALMPAVPAAFVALAVDWWHDRR